MTTMVNDVIWLWWLLKDLDLKQSVPTQLLCDNLDAKHIANNPVFHQRIKHMEMDCYFVREHVESKEVQPLHIEYKSQVADLFTKALGGKKTTIVA